METATQKNDTRAPLLEMRGIRKEFPGVVALDSVDFDLLPGEVHALIGENGAGKSTMIKIISGLYHADSGQMLVDGSVVDFRGPADSIGQHSSRYLEHDHHQGEDALQEVDLLLGQVLAEPERHGKGHKEAGVVETRQPVYETQIALELLLGHRPLLVVESLFMNWM